MSLCEWDGWSTGQSNTKKEVTNAAEERLLLSHKLTLEELYEWTEPWLVCLYLSVFFFHPLCISLSICLFLYLSLWPFVSEQLCGCAYIKCNPAGQWERYKERELLLPLLPPINYYSLCLFFLCFFLYCHAASPTTIATCIQKWEEGEKERHRWVRAQIWTSEATEADLRQRNWNRNICGRRM